MNGRSGPSTLSLLLWPTVITAAVSVLRLILELQGVINTRSGGGGAWLGISWLMLVFGAWFAFRLRRAGSTPKSKRAWLWAVAVFAGLFGAAVFIFAGFDIADTSEAAYQELRTGVLTIACVAPALGAVSLLVWPRLGFTLLLYAIPARLTVIAITWLAVDRGWDTHYQKLGPAGFERDLEETMLAVTAAQMGLWVPLTVITGMVAGTLLTGWVRKRKDG